jgi:hypothetical protein
MSTAAGRHPHTHTRGGAQPPSNPPPRCPSRAKENPGEAPPMMTPKRLAVELGRRLDGPHADEHTAGAAQLCAESVRFLNYATGSHSPEGLCWPSTAYEIAADMQLAASRMPQCFGQLADWLRRENTAGMLATDDGTPPAEVVATAGERLASAALFAQRLATELAALQSAISGLNGRGPARTGGAL